MAGSPDVYKKADWENHDEKASKQHCSTAAASFYSSNLLSWAPVLISLHDELRLEHVILHKWFILQVTFWPWCLVIAIDTLTKSYSDKSENFANNFSEDGGADLQLERKGRRIVNRYKLLHFVSTLIQRQTNQPNNSNKNNIIQRWGAILSCKV